MAAIVNLAVVWALISVFDSRRLRHVVTGVALLGIVVAGVMSVGDLPASFAQSDMIEAVGRLNGPTPRALDRQTRYLVQSFDTSQLGFVSKGLFVSLSRQGFQVFVPPDSVSDIAYGSWRVATPDRVDALLSVVDIAESGWQPPPNGRLVASYDPLSPAERARSTELEAKIRTRWALIRLSVPSCSRNTAGPSPRTAGASAAEIDELLALQKRGDGFSVYLSPAP